MLPDLHFPAVHKKGYKLALDVFQDIGIDEICQLGDFIDANALSSHDKNPLVIETFKDELYEANLALDEWQERFPDAKKTLLFGNHSNRLNRYIAKNAPALYGLFTLDIELRLNQRGVELVPYGQYQMHKVQECNLYLRHEPASGGENIAKPSLKKMLDCSMICGHTHRIEEASVTSFKGNVYTMHSIGHLTDKMAPQMQYGKNPPSWQLGFGVITVVNKTEWFFQQCHVKEVGDKFMTVCDGNLYEV